MADVASVIRSTLTDGSGVVLDTNGDPSPMDMAEELDFGIGNPFEAVHEGGSCQATLEGLRPNYRYAFRIIAANSVGPSSPGPATVVATEPAGSIIICICARRAPVCIHLLLLLFLPLLLLLHLLRRLCLLHPRPIII